MGKLIDENGIEVILNANKEYLNNNYVKLKNITSDEYDKLEESDNVDPLILYIIEDTNNS
ncbi:MAG: hypothetical protein J1F35_08240 [Erysipelotrichales bacterium]|nr:hypothetical protein [Erysipelotrichales bacterium]